MRRLLKNRKASRMMQRLVLPIVQNMQKPGHSVPLDVLCDPFVLGYIRSYSLIAIHQAVGGTEEEEKKIYADTIETLFSVLAGNSAAGKQMGQALVNHSKSDDPNLRNGSDLAARHWLVVCGSNAIDDDPEIVEAFQHANALTDAATSVFGPNDDTPQQAAARFLHAKLLHYVSEKYGVENPDWRQWVRGW